jgi:hypothetical protein
VGLLFQSGLVRSQQQQTQPNTQPIVAKMYQLSCLVSFYCCLPYSEDRATRRPSWQRCKKQQHVSGDCWGKEFDDKML